MYKRQASTVPSAAALQAPANGTTPAVPSTVAPATAAAPASTAQRVVVSTDVLRLVLDGGNILQADLLAYPQTKAEGLSLIHI